MCCPYKLGQFKFPMASFAADDGIRDVTLLKVPD